MSNWDLFGCLLPAAAVVLDADVGLWAEEVGVLGTTVLGGVPVLCKVNNNLDFVVGLVFVRDEVVLEWLSSLTVLLPVEACQLLYLFVSLTRDQLQLLWPDLLGLV